MAETLYPSLTETGYLSDPNDIADFIFSDFYTSEYSQTLSGFGQVASLQYILTKNQNDMEGVQNDCKNILTSYFSRYFTSVSVRVSVEQQDKQVGKFNLFIAIGFKDKEGKQYSLNKILESSNSKIYPIIEKINN